MKTIDKIDEYLTEGIFDKRMSSMKADLEKYQGNIPDAHIQQITNEMEKIENDIFKLSLVLTKGKYKEAGKFGKIASTMKKAKNDFIDNYYSRM